MLLKVIAVFLLGFTIGVVYTMLVICLRRSS
jgi:hypothetical protein